MQPFKLVKRRALRRHPFLRQQPLEEVIVPAGWATSANLWDPEVQRVQVSHISETMNNTLVFGTRRLKSWLLLSSGKCLKLHADQSDVTPLSHSFDRRPPHSRTFGDHWGLLEGYVGPIGAKRGASILPPPPQKKKKEVPP